MPTRGELLQRWRDVRHSLTRRAWIAYLANFTFFQALAMCSHDPWMPKLYFLLSVAGNSAFCYLGAARLYSMGAQTLPFLFFLLSVVVMELVL
jgi:hypothetical protein